MSKDFINLLLKLWRVSYLYSFLKIFTIKVYRSFSVRYLRGTMIGYPKEIKLLAKKIPTASKPIFKEPANYSFDIKNLKLATGQLNYEVCPDWKVEFNSHEQFVSLHRWNWLLRSATDENERVDLAWGMTMVRSWFSVMGVIPRGDASESYTLGERISNICLFNRHITGNWDSMPKDIQRALQFKCKYLAHRLEFLPGNLTGNHIINNARALLFVGHCCQIEQSISLSREILRSFLPQLIDSKGFLREGSSHYQFLITRWLLEVRLVAEEKEDFKTLDIIKSYLPKLVNACDFFLVESQNGGKLLSLFGDISPDCEPNWLKDLTKAPLAKFNSGERVNEKLEGWANLFQGWQENPLNIWEVPQRENNFFWENNSNGWYRLDFKGWTAIWHAEESSGKAIASHAHHDYGSVALYRNGREILIDPGRLDYENQPLSNYGISHRAHSTISLNGFAPMLSKRDYLYPEIYRKTFSTVTSKEKDDIFTISIEHNGFKRIPGNIMSHKREFIFSATSVDITDSFEGNGSYNLEIYYQWPVTYRNKVKADKKFNFKEELSKNLNVEMSTNLGKKETFSTEYFHGSYKPIAGWRFFSFGDTDLAITQKFNSNIKLPYKYHYKISVLRKTVSQKSYL